MVQDELDFLTEKYCLKKRLIKSQVCKHTGHYKRIHCIVLVLNQNIFATDFYEKIKPFDAFLTE